MMGGLLLCAVHQAGCDREPTSVLSEDQIYCRVEADFVSAEVFSAVYRCPARYQRPVEQRAAVRVFRDLVRDDQPGRGPDLKEVRPAPD